MGHNDLNETYYAPLVDIIVTKTEIIVRADLPGVSKEQIELALEDNILTIHGRMDSKTIPGDLILQEFENGHFFRKFNVSDAVDQDNITASLKHGTLEVTLPKVIHNQPISIQIDQE